MASREEYNQCIRPYMTGTGKTREERQRAMCIGAKLCTGKASTEAEADKICRELPPKEPKTTKTVRRTGARCHTQASEVSACLLGKLEAIDLSTTSLKDTLGDMLSECLCGSKPKVTKAQKAQKAYEAMSEQEKEALRTIAEVSAYYGTG